MVFDDNSSIGGYFSLEFKEKSNSFEHDIKVNTARNAFKLILLNLKPNRIFIPYFICGVMYSVLKELNVEYYSYNINDDFTPKVNLDQITDNDLLLYVNYFGVNDQVSNFVIQKFGANKVIIDASQALFYVPEVQPLAIIYSPRKFMALPDGGLLRTSLNINLDYQQDKSSHLRMKHLCMRFDNTPEEGYHYYLDSEKSLNKESIKLMSNLTANLFNSYTHDELAQRRKENFSYLHDVLGHINHLDTGVVCSSLIYPFLIKNGKEVKDKLLKNRFFVATYWPDISFDSKLNSFEKELINNLISIPCDQRYTENDLVNIVNVITS